MEVVFMAHERAKTHQDSQDRELASKLDPGAAAWQHTSHQTKRQRHNPGTAHGVRSSAPRYRQSEGRACQINRHHRHDVRHGG